MEAPRKYRPPLFTFFCTHCTSHDVRYAQRKWFDWMVDRAGFEPLLCRRCLRRFYVQSSSPVAASSLPEVLIHALGEMRRRDNATQRFFHGAAWRRAVEDFARRRGWLA